MGVQKFGFKTTAIQAIEGRDLTGKVAVVTGGNSGIGLETVRALCYAGCNVVLCCRNTVAGQEAADEVKASFPDSKVRWRLLKSHVTYCIEFLMPMYNKYSSTVSDGPCVACRVR